MTEQSIYARLVRRETHRSRSTAVVGALVVMVLVVAYVGTESVLAAIGRPALLVTPGGLLAALHTPAVWSGGAAAGFALLGLVALIAALTRGRRSRHRLADDRMAVIVDDDVLAGALSRQVALSGSVDRRQAITEVARRRATVRLTPNSGFAVDRDSASAAAARAIEQLAPHPTVRTRVIVADQGVLS